MKKLLSVLILLTLLMLPMHNTYAEEVLTPYYPSEHAAAFEKAAVALQTHTPGAIVDYAVRERDDGEFEWKLFFTLNGQLGEAEILEEAFSVRRVRLYDMPEGSLTAFQTMNKLMQEKGILTIVDLELDNEKGRIYYEGEAMLDALRYEFEISVTGEIIEWERD